ncbi:AI-2E family transporter [Clostridiales bacterium COT073_COT-073]|nr:AI-2E family transporter [Clostridiales bacterium COT073_COT-073]
MLDSKRRNGYINKEILYLIFTDIGDNPKTGMKKEEKMKLTSDEKRKIIVTLIIITVSIILYHIFNNIGAFTKSAEKIYRASFSQITAAFFIAYLLNIPMRYIEGFLNTKTKLKAGAKRGLSILLTIVLCLLVLIVLLRFAIPQLTESVNRLSQNIDGYISAVKNWLNTISLNFDYQLPQVVIDKITEMFNSLVNMVSRGIGLIAESLYGWISGTLSSLFDFVVSFAVSIYMLVEKERIMLVLKKMLYSVFSASKGDRIIWFLKILNNSFSNFFRGQITEGLILAVLAIVSMTILGFEFSILIGSIVGLTNIIPMFGAFLGGAVGFIILLMVNPIQALWFALFVIILQQIESNIIYPRVVGNAIGLSGFWIFVAVIVGGGIAGLSGIILGIPLFTTLQEVLKEFTDKQLKARAAELPQDLRLEINKPEQPSKE